MDSLIGRQIGPYVITAKLGEGGMAVVYKAHQPSLNRDVAIKILTGPMARDEEFVNRFRREAVAAGGLGHPNILTIYDAGFTDDGLHYIVMELASGGTLKELLERGPLPPERARDIAAQLAGALQTAHEHGIVHRDLKPSNVLFARDGRPLLMDFGVALTGSGTRFTRTGMTVGTPEYMSPEQAQGLLVDGRSDVYSLGILLYEMLTGDLPFVGDTPVSTLYQQVHQPPPLERLRAAAVPAWLGAAVERALAKQPADRFPDARTMAAALRGEIPVGGSPTGQQVWPAPPTVLRQPMGEGPAQPVAAPKSRRQLAQERKQQHIQEEARQQELARQQQAQQAAQTPPPKRRRGRGRLVFTIIVLTIACLGCWAASRLVSQVSFEDMDGLEEFLTTARPAISDLIDNGASAGQTATAVVEATWAAQVATQVAAQATADAAATATAPDEWPAEDGEWLSLVEDDFSADTGLWATGPYEDERVSGSRSIVGGAYRWEAHAWQDVSWWTPVAGITMDDFVLMFTAEQISGPPSAAFGVVFRQSPQGDAYVLRIRQSGEYSLALSANGTWSDLVPWTAWGSIWADGPNLVTLVAQGSTFGLVINEDYIDLPSDSSLSDGWVNLGIMLQYPGDEAVIEFGDVMLSAP